MNPVASGPTVVIDRSNLARDRLLLGAGRAADLSFLNEFTRALDQSATIFSQLHSVTHRSLSTGASEPDGSATRILATRP